MKLDVVELCDTHSNMLLNQKSQFENVTYCIVELFAFTETLRIITCTLIITTIYE